MKHSNLLIAAIAALFISSCGQMGFEKTKSGLQYKIVKSGEGEKLQQGDFVKFQYKLTYKDSVVMSTYGVLPAFDQVDSVGRFHDFSEILTKLKVGDSVVTFQFYDSMQKNITIWNASIFEERRKATSHVENIKSVQKQCYSGRT